MVLEYNSEAKWESGCHPSLSREIGIPIFPGTVQLHTCYTIPGTDHKMLMILIRCSFNRIQFKEVGNMVEGYQATFSQQRGTLTSAC